MASLQAIAQQLADAIGSVTTEFDDLQVVPFLWFNPTVPAVDIYPADPSQEDLAFGRTPRTILWTVRARVGSTDSDAQQAVLLRLMEPYGPSSVRAAILYDRTLADTVENVKVDGPGGYQLYDDIGGSGRLLGVEWTVRVFNDTADEVS